jgi:hypothetical protein
MPQIAGVPRHRDTLRMFEGTSKITADHVIRVWASSSSVRTCPSGK